MPIFLEVLLKFTTRYSQKIPFSGIINMERRKYAW